MVFRSKSPKVDLSLILTGYNEGPALPFNLEKVKKVLDDTRFRWEIILWDDKSKDETPKIFKHFAKKNRSVRFFANEENMGRGGTVKKAMKEAKGYAVGYIDTDLELPPIHIPEFVREIESGADVVVAKRIYAIGVSNFLRAILSRGYVFLVKAFLKIELNDTEAGFKFFNRRKIIPIVKKVKDDRWFFDTEIVSRSLWAHLTVKEIPVVYHYNNEKGSSVNLLRDSVIYFAKLLEFRKKRPHENRHSHR